MNRNFETSILASETGPQSRFAFCDRRSEFPGEGTRMAMKAMARSMRPVQSAGRDCDLLLDEVA